MYQENEENFFITLLKSIFTLKSAAGAADFFVEGIHVIPSEAKNLFSIDPSLTLRMTRSLNIPRINVL